MQRFQTRLNNAITCVKSIYHCATSSTQYKVVEDMINLIQIIRRTLFFSAIYFQSQVQTYVYRRNVNYSWLPYDRQCRQPLRKKLHSLRCFRFAYHCFLIEIIVWNNAGKQIFVISFISEIYASLKCSYKPLHIPRRSKIHTSLPFLSITLFARYKSHHCCTMNPYCKSFYKVT